MATLAMDHDEAEGRVFDLCYPERLILWSIRRWLENPCDQSAIEQALWSACGIVEIEAALQGLCGLCTVLARQSRNIFYLHRPECPCLSSDERTVLALIAAHQAGDAEQAWWLAGWLVPADALDVLMAHVAMLAGALRRRNHVLPVRELGSAAPFAPRGRA